MNLIKKLLLIFLICAPYCNTTKAAFNEVTLQEFGEFILSSLQKLDEKSLEPETLHMLCNIFFAAFEHARFDLAYVSLLRSLIHNLQSLKSTSQSVTLHADALNTLAYYEKNRAVALLRWNHASEYMNSNKEIAEIFSQIALERLEFLNSLVSKYGQEYSNLVANLYTDASTTTLKLTTLSQCLKAAHEKQLPLEYAEHHSRLREIDMVSNLIQCIDSEINELQSKLIGFEEFLDDCLSACAILDMLYFNKLHELLFEKTEDERYSMILFNEHGLIPEHERKDLLPYVIN